MDQEKRRVNLLKQKIGIEYFPSTLVRDAGVIHEGNREDWAALKRAEETYISLHPRLRGAEGAVLVGKNAHAPELVHQSIQAMRELSTILLGDSEQGWESVSILTKTVDAYAARPNSRKPR